MKNKAYKRKISNSQWLVITTMIVITTLFGVVLLKVNNSSDEAIQQPHSAGLINSIRHDVRLNSDKTLSVREEYQLEKREGDLINYGIIRLFSKEYVTQGLADQALNYSEIGLEHITGRGLIEIPKTEFTEQESKVYIGDPTTPLSAGLHSFILRYKVEGAVVDTESGHELFFAGFETGNFSAYKSEISFSFPSEVNTTNIQVDAFVETSEIEEGPKKSENGKEYVLLRRKRLSDATQITNIDGEILVQNSRPLNQGERISVIINY